MLTTNSLVSRIFRSVSLASPWLAPVCFGCRSPGANASRGGSTQTVFKNEKGARLSCLDALTVDTHAIGRRATELWRMLYRSLCEGSDGLTIILSSIDSGVHHFFAANTS